MDSELLSVPIELREVLEIYLSDDPTPELLDEFNPEIRRILYNLLVALHNQQEVWQQRVSNGHAAAESTYLNEGGGSGAGERPRGNSVNGRPRDI